MASTDHSLTRWPQYNWICAKCGQDHWFLRRKCARCNHKDLHRRTDCPECGKTVDRWMIAEKFDGKRLELDATIQKRNIICPHCETVFEARIVVDFTLYKTSWNDD